MFYKAKPFNYLFGEKREGWMEQETKAMMQDLGKKPLLSFNHLLM